MFTSKDHHSFTNYRPITLFIYVFQKYLKKLFIRDSFSPLTDDIFYESQYELRPNHSTTHAVIELAYSILCSFEDKKATLATFLDLSEAFDTIDHDILLQKLSHYRIGGIVLDWFASRCSVVLQI